MQKNSRRIGYAKKNAWYVTQARVMWAEMQMLDFCNSILISPAAVGVRANSHSFYPKLYRRSKALRSIKKKKKIVLAEWPHSSSAIHPESIASQDD